MLALGVSNVSAAPDDCMEGAKTDLEKMHCQVLGEGLGASLPSVTDFRRNDPQVQALLLRRPAERLGLDVPEPEPAPAQADGEFARSALQDNRSPTDGQLADCRLNGERISCFQRHYDLAINQPNSQLAEGVLELDNSLGLSSFEGNRVDEDAVRRYLSDAYDRYIAKMLDIGLGANTMSFTAFHNAFHTMEEHGVDFAGRMEHTFVLLKQDKKTMAVKARYQDDLPEDLSLCTVISADIIVCDNVGTNWVYVSPGR